VRDWGWTWSPHPQLQLVPSNISALLNWIPNSGGIRAIKIVAETSTTSLCWASSLGSQHDATRICCWARRPQLSIDICCTRPRLAANQSHAPLLLSIDGTDGRTDNRPLHKPCSAYCARSVDKLRTRRALTNCRQRLPPASPSSAWAYSDSSSKTVAAITRSRSHDISPRLMDADDCTMYNAMHVWHDRAGKTNTARPWNERPRHAVHPLTSTHRPTLPVFVFADGEHGQCAWTPSSVHTAARHRRNPARRIAFVHAR